MKSYAITFTVLAVMLVCMLGQQQQASASVFGRLGHELDEGAKDVARGVSDGADDVAKDASKVVANNGPTIQKVDKVANEIEPVAKVVATGIEIGSAFDSLAVA